MVYAFLIAALLLLYALAWSLAVTRLAWRAWRATGRFGPHLLGTALAAGALMAALAWTARRFLQLASGAA